ncbi:MAG: IS701 family transposase, partial [Anaerolineae bacterium]
WKTRPETGVPEWVGRGPHPTKEQVLPGEPAPQRVDDMAAALKPEDWQLYQIKEGSKGPMVAAFSFMRGIAVRKELPGPDVWIVFRRSLGNSPELKVYVSNAAFDTPVTELVRMAGLRWPVETAIQEGKEGLGMDHYEVRSWLGWHHHMTECLLAHHFLVRCRKRLKRGHQH